MLIIEPGEPHDDLGCRLKEVPSPLLETERYEALSYAWGDDNSSEYICVTSDDEPPHEHFCSRFYIKPNLVKVLERLRLKDKERTIWIDAICIDQENLSERASQVLLMREIYANARQVLIWLGEKQDGDEHAFEYLDRICTRLHEVEDNLEEERVNTSKIMFDQLEIRNHLVALLQRRWFHRTWVVQEVASAQKAVFLYGSKLLSWETVSKAVTTLRQNTSSAMTFEEASQIRHPQENLFAMEMARRSANGTFPLSLFELLLATSFNECSDSRDKVYAVLGLATDWQEIRELTPDYRHDITPEKVFQRFAVWDIKQNRSLRILSCATGNELSPLPSWVPDWRNIKNPDAFSRYNASTRFSAATSMPMRIWFSDHGQVLNVLGEVVDLIKRTGSEPKFSRIITTIPMQEDCLSRLKTAHDWLQECYKLAPDANGIMTKNRFNEFWRTMTCGLKADGYPAPVEYGAYFEKYLTFITHKMIDLRDSKESAAFKMVLRIGEDDPDSKVLSLIESSLEKWSSRRRFCTTNKGRLAFVPPDSRSGDLICIFYGGEVPYVLRPSEPGVYTLIGECYVDGIMHGEAVSEGGVRTKDFRLI